MFKKIRQLASSCLELITKKETVLLFKIKNRLRTPARTLKMRVLSILGAAGFIWMLPAGVMLTNKKTRLDGILVFVGLGIDIIINNLVTKFFFHRIRPCVVYPQEYLRYSLPFGFSFPSGHALTSATGATIYILVNPLNSIWALPLAGLICFSRLYLFDHYPTDVLIGAVDGVISGRGVYRIGHKLYAEDAFPTITALIDDDALYQPINYLTRPGRVKILESIDRIIISRLRSIAF